MPDFSDLSVGQTIAVYLAAGAVVYILGALAFDVYADVNELAHNNDLAGVKLGFFEPLASVGIVTALTFAWLQYGTLVGEIQKETTALTVLATSAETMPEPTRSTLSAAIRAYAAAVAGPEWRMMATEGRGSEVCAEALRTLVRTYAAAEGHTPRERMILRFSGKQLINLSQSREMRLEGATMHIRAALLVMLFGCVILALFTSWFFGLPSLLAKIAMGVLFTWSMILVVVYLSALMQPFSGALAVSRDGYLDIVRSLAPEPS